MTTNPYYSAGALSPFTLARAQVVNAEFTKIQTAFDGLHDSLNDWGRATSSSSIAIGSGTKSLNIEGGHFINVGQNIIIADTAAPSTNYMVGQVLTYDSETGDATVDVNEIGGSGTKTAWSISITALGEATRILGYTGGQTMAMIKAGLDLTGVTTASVALLAPLASPTFTGDPTAPTPSKADDDTSIATTAHVQANTLWTQIASAVGGTGVSTITFSSIPTHWKDLKVDISPFAVNISESFSVGISNDGSNWSSVAIDSVTATSSQNRFAISFLNAQADVGTCSAGFTIAGGTVLLSTGLGAGSAVLPRLWIATGGIKHIRITVGNGKNFTSDSAFRLMGR